MQIDLPRLSWYFIKIILVIVDLAINRMISSLILIRVHAETDYPRASREAAQTFRIGGQTGQTLLQLTNDSIQAVKYLAGRFRLAPFIQGMFSRVHFRRHDRLGCSMRSRGLCERLSSSHRPDDIALSGICSVF